MPPSGTKELKTLSASKIKTWETCSWLYYCKYELKLPDSTNDGALRGTLCHKVFEILQNPRHRSHYKAIVADHSVAASTAVRKFVLKMARKSGIDDQTNLDMILEMIVIGLKNDFFIEGAEKVEKPEFKFDATDENNRFRVKGFIDLLAVMKDGSALIRDYKSSKAKFSKAELNPNLQNLIYSWFVYQTKKILAKTQFVFLRFPKQPIQEARVCTIEELKGVEEYFAYVSKQIQNFDEEKGKKSYASRSKETSWLCGKTEPGKWCCAYRKPFDYYALVDFHGTVKKTAFVESELTAKDGEYIEKRHYGGCPRYN